MSLRISTTCVGASLLAGLLASLGPAFGQSQVELTARELFYIPVSSPSPKGAGPAKPAAPVASRTEPGAKKTTPHKSAAEAQDPPRPDREPGWGEVKLVTAHYNGNRPLGLRYSLYQYEQVDGRWQAQQVAPDRIFQTGDRIQIQVESNEDGYLYILQRGTSGLWSVLFPSKEIHGGKNRVTAMEAVRIPSGRAFFTFSGNPGTEKIYIVLSRKPVADAEEMILDLSRGKPVAAVEPARSETVKKEAKKPEPKKASAPKSTTKSPWFLAQAIAPIDDPLTGRPRPQLMARDLVFEKVDVETADQKDKSIYVVDKSGRPDANLVVELPLKHQ